MTRSFFSGTPGALSHGAPCRRPFPTGFAVLVCLVAILALMMPSPMISIAHASEGGVSVYPPGTYGDFALNITPPGFTVRENIFYSYGKLDNYPTAVSIPGLGTVAGYSNLDLNNWVNLVQVLYSTQKFKLLGGRYFAALNIPAASAHLTADVSIPGIGNVANEEGNTSGLADFYIVPAGLLWDLGHLHLRAAEDIIAPVGQYNSDNLVNVGKNHWAYDTLFGATWLDPDHGHEISFTAGYIVNSENPDTHYRTGDEFHVDYTLAQYLSKTFGVGVVGYYYKQVTPDSGSGYDNLNAVFGGRLDGYKSETAAVGPALMWTPTTIEGRPLNIIAKWLYQYQAKNCFKGGSVFVSAAVNF